MSYVFCTIQAHDHLTLLLDGSVLVAILLPRSLTFFSSFCFGASRALDRVDLALVSPAADKVDLVRGAVEDGVENTLPSRSLQNVKQHVHHPNT